MESIHFSNIMNAYRDLYNRISPITAKVSPAVYDAAAKAMLFLVAGGAAYLFFPALAPPMLTIAATIIASRLVIKIADIYHFKPVETIQLKLADFRDKHRFIQVALVTVIIAVGVFSWKAACILAVPYGLYAAVVIGLDYYVSIQNVGRRRENEGIIASEADAVYIP